MQKDNSHTGKWADSKLNELVKKWGKEKIKNWMPNEKWRIEENFTIVDENAIDALFEKKEEQKKHKYIVIEFPSDIEIEQYRIMLNDFCENWPTLSIK